MLMGDAVHPMMPQLVTSRPCGHLYCFVVLRAEELGPGWLPSDRGRLKANRHEPMKLRVRVFLESSSARFVSPSSAL